MNTKTMHSSTQAIVAVIGAALARKPKRNGSTVTERRYAARRSLGALDDRILKDIGYGRADPMGRESRAVLEHLMKTQLW